MPEDKSELFRKRVEVGSDSGLATARRPTRPEGLTINPEAFDLKKDFLDDFAGVTPVEPGAVEVAKGNEGFSVGEIDVGALDQALQKVHWEQTDQQIRELTEEARRLIEEGDFYGALYVLEDARAIAPAEGTIFYLIGLCHFFLGDFEAGYEELGLAMDHAADNESLAAAALLRIACLRSIVDEIGKQVTELKKKGRLREALALVEENLKRYPSSITLLYQRCELLLSLGLAEQAKQAAQDAIERGGEENAPLFRRMFEQATHLAYRPLLEPVRQALRVDEASKANKLLKAAHSTLNGQQFYAAVCAYTREKRPASGMLSIFSRSREPEVSIPSEQLQKLLRWLVSEELDAAHDAFDQGNYGAAIAQLKKATNIDSRCTHVNYLHGLSLYRAFLELLNIGNQALDLDQCAKDLKAAGGYVQEAAADPALTDRSRELSAAISGYYEQVNQLLREFARREKEAQVIIDLLNKYNEYMDRLEKYGVTTTQEWQSSREQMLRFKQQAETLRSSCADEQGREFLTKLAQALDSNLKGLDKIKDEVQRYSLVYESLLEYEKMITEFKRSPISTHYELQIAKARLQVILNKLASFRTALGYKEKAPASTLSFRDYINNWEPDMLPTPMGGRTKPANVDAQVWDLMLKLEDSVRENMRMIDSPRRY
jgi:hypothetical protein